MENKPSNKKIPSWGWVLIVLFVPGFLLSLLTTVFPSKEVKTDTETKVQREVKEENRQTQASINFTGTTFIITNRNDFDWDRVEIIINEKYRYETGGIKSGATYEVGAGQFTDSRHNRFNPFEVEPAEIRVYVKEPMSDDWYGELN